MDEILKLNDEIIGWNFDLSMKDAPWTNYKERCTMK